MTLEVRDPQPPAEGDLIRIARLAKGLSPEQAAELALIKLGGARWRQIERGYKTRDSRVRAPDKTLAHMAHVVGVSPERLDAVDRGVAAEILREIQRQEAEADPERNRPYADLSDRLERTAWEMPASIEDRKLMVDMLREARAQGRGERGA